MQESESSLAGPSLPMQDAWTSTRSPVDNISMETAEGVFRVEKVWKGSQVLEEAFHTIGFVTYIPRGPTGALSYQERQSGAAQTFRSLIMLALCFAFGGMISAPWLLL